MPQVHAQSRTWSRDP